MTNKEMIGILQAYEDGKDIEFRPLYITDYWRKYDGRVVWDFSHYEYRIKPQEGKEMTNEEAIKHGEEQLEIFCGTHKEFIKKAIEALNKQIPKSVVINEHGDPTCPACGCYIEPLLPKYCENCGQKIDWNEE